LAQVLRQLPKPLANPNVLVGTDTSDDGGVYQLTEDIALIQTLDYFTPIVDDPYMFGQIAAANALSDIYAMGGTPLTALNIVGYPMSVLGPEILGEILKGAGAKVIEAGAVTLGGHSIDDKEPKFGLSVTGTAHPSKIYKNVGAKPGERLVLTKPIGVGIQTTAIKRDLLERDKIDKVTQVMAMLNKKAAELLKSYTPSAVTDITGFGLLGHSFEMASGSHVSFYINHRNVPVLEGTEELVQLGSVPGGSKKNLQWLKQDVAFDEEVSESQRLILADAITSGGLLVSLEKDEAEAYVRQLHEAGITDSAIIGEVIEKKDKTIYVR
jgi:selenide, water dikinase